MFGRLTFSFSRRFEDWHSLAVIIQNCAFSNIWINWVHAARDSQVNQVTESNCTTWTPETSVQARHFGRSNSLSGIQEEGRGLTCQTHAKKRQSFFLFHGFCKYEIIWTLTILWYWSYWNPYSGMVVNPWFFWGVIYTHCKEFHSWWWDNHTHIPSLLIDLQNLHKPSTLNHHWTKIWPLKGWSFTSLSTNG
jgi:hypothetical protein